MTTTAVRSLPLPVQVPVAGVSFRQADVARTYTGERVTVCHVTHPEDPDACEIRGSDGRLLGYVPAALAARVVATMGASGHISGTVAAVVGSETLGLRVSLDRVEVDDGAQTHLG